MIIDKEICVGCGACVGTCSFKAIGFDGDGKAVIDQEKCKKCGDCKDVCPVSAISE